MRSFWIVLMILLLPLSVNAEKLKGNHCACLDQRDLLEIIHAAKSKDTETWNSLMNDKKCFLPKKDTEVIIKGGDEKNFCRRVQVRGIEQLFWVLSVDIVLSEND